MDNPIWAIMLPSLRPSNRVESIRLIQTSVTKLLIVEDMKSTRLLIKGVLGKEGYTVLQAENGAEGVELFKREAPDVVLMDVMMPVMDGFEACRRIRQLDRDEGTPIIMLTGAEDIEAIEQAFEAGATDFITKPINWPLLSQRVRYALRNGQLVREVRQNRLRQTSAQRIAKLGFWSWTPSEDIFEWSEDAASLLGYPIDHLNGLDAFIDSIASEDRERVRRTFLLAGSSDVRIELEVRLKGESGERIFRVVGERGTEGSDLDRLFGAIQDVTDTRRAEALVDYLALHDDLTGLGNRRLFSQSIRNHLEALRKSNNRKLVVGWIDLLRFHRHNDALGESVGDALLIQVGQRLRMLAIDGEVARVGGDEFAVLLLVDSYDEGLDRFKHLIDGLDHPFKVDAVEAFLTCSAGIACFPEDSADAEELLTLAQEAQRLARTQARKIVRGRECDGQVRSDILDVERALRKALTNNEFHLVFQPQMNLREGRIVGVESLLRWKHPVRGFVSPVEFIPLLEESGHIVDVGAWVIREACLQAQRWDAAGTPLRVSINLSPRQFQDPTLFDTIITATRDAGISARSIELEITESMAMQNPEHAIAMLARLRELGYTIAIDDFGIGYSSLEYLLRFPLDVIKIDRTFVTHITESQSDRAIVRAITAIAQTLGSSTIAEGIETLRQCDFIEALGVNEIQGYLIGKPMHAPELEALIHGFVRPGRA